MALGLGKSEILKVEVHPHSRLANKPLGCLKPRSWRAGILYRDGQIIAPKGDTRLKPRDRVVVMGYPQVVWTVADLLTFRFTRFPLEYGDTLVAWLEPYSAEAFLPELGYLMEIFLLSKLFCVQCHPGDQLTAKIEPFNKGQSLEQFEQIITAQDPVDRSLPDAIRPFCRRPGLVVMLDRQGNGQNYTWARKTLRSLSEKTTTLLLLAALSHPYNRVAVPFWRASQPGRRWRPPSKTTQSRPSP